jgi:hypothetical protein
MGRVERWAIGGSSQHEADRVLVRGNMTEWKAIRFKYSTRFLPSAEKTFPFCKAASLFGAGWKDAEGKPGAKTCDATFSFTPHRL